MSQVIEDTNVGLQEFVSVSGAALSARELKEEYLSGVPLVTKDGEPITDTVLNSHIRKSISWLERQVEISIHPRVIEDERHDYYIDDYRNFAYINLNHFPVIKVTRWLAAYPGNNMIYDFILEWVHVHGRSGQIQLVPTQGTLSQVIMTAGGNFLPLLYAATHIPDFFHIDYVCGFKKGEVPDDVMDAVAKRAAIQILRLVGEQIGGLGIANMSVSIDGLSQSTGTTKEGGNVFGGRIRDYKEELDQEVKALRNYYKGLKMVVV